MFGINERMRRRAAERGPIRVSVIGSGSMGGPLIDQIAMAPGMQVDVVVDLDLDKARTALRDAGTAAEAIAECGTLAEAEAAVAAGRTVLTARTEIAWTLPGIEAVVEATGNPGAFAVIATETIRAGRHLVTFNVEGDVLVGNILKRQADAAGVVYTGIHGDEPGVVKVLHDEADALGFEVLAAGRHDYGGGDVKWTKENIGPHLARVSARTVQHNLSLYASFCDGSKTNEECCMIANATGLVPAVRGMHGPTVSYGEFAQKVPQLLDLRENGGILDRVGVVERIMPAEGETAQPVWCFVVVRIRNEMQRVFMTTMSGLGAVLGGGSIGAAPMAGDNRGTTGIFYTPYHYCAVQAPISIALAVIDGQATIAPRTDGRFADVMALAKKDLAVGEEIDEIGGVCVAGRVDRASVVRNGKFLPFALAHRARLVRPVKAGDYVTYDDVDLSAVPERLRALRAEQDAAFPVLA